MDYGEFLFFNYFTVLLFVFLSRSLTYALSPNTKLVRQMHVKSEFNGITNQVCFNNHFHLDYLFDQQLKSFVSFLLNVEEIKVNSS